ncbi:hypothetical protein X975_19141, partial [Stegodyphus mimosarum]
MGQQMVFSAVYPLNEEIFRIIQSRDHDLAAQKKSEKKPDQVLLMLTFIHSSIENELLKNKNRISVLKILLPTRTSEIATTVQSSSRAASVCP